ncbi:MAG: peptidyl-prolyl cis-trans isomerase, partial [Deltaproteobacteria bacterium]|nr:peptidyl-prolyl cis-trans isomerase [Deltaproteobacteria bacterium]
MNSNPSILKYLLCVIMLAVYATAGAQSTPTVPPDTVVAKIGDQSVTEADLQQMANAVPERFRHLYLTPEGRQKTLEYVVNVYVLANEAASQGLDKSPDAQKLMEFTKKDLLARLYLDKVTANLPEPTDEEAKRYFEEHRAEYQTPETVHLHHILVQTEKEAQKVLERLKKGDKFAEVAKQVSTCPSKGKGGDLDWLPKGSLLPEIEAVAFSMQDGQIGGPVKTTFGYHVLFLEGKRPAQDSSLEQV